MSAIGFNFTIDFPVVGEWENVDEVRLSLQSCISHLFQSVDHRELLAMVAGVGVAVAGDLAGDRVAGGFAGRVLDGYPGLEQENAVEDAEEKQEEDDRDQ